MKPIQVIIPSLNKPNSQFYISITDSDDKIEFSSAFKKNAYYPKKDKQNKHGYTRETLLEKAKEIYLASRPQKEEEIINNDEAQTPYSPLRRQSMFAETGGMLGACVMPTIALGVMVAFIAPLTALFPSFIALAGVSTAIFLMAAIVGTIIGAVAGMAAEYMTRPENSMIAAI